MATGKQWFTLQSLPCDIYVDDDDCISYGVVVSLNDHQFIIISDRDVENDYYPSESIYKYNAHNDEWHAFIDFPKDLCLDNYSVTINEVNNKLYLLEGNRMIVIDIKTEQFHTYFFGTKNNIAVTITGTPGLVNVNGTTHIIGGSGNSKHLTWNDTNNLFDEMHDFCKDGIVSHIRGPSAVYVPSQKIILMFGGTNGESTRMIGFIWKYDIYSNKWSKVNGIKFDFSDTSSVLTSNEEYVVISGGINKDFQDIDIIHVLDIRDKNNYILKECSIKCPMNGYHPIIRSGGGLKDELLVIGWIKHLFNSSPFNDMTLISSDIMQLISMWYYQETIHWIEFENIDDRQSNNHFGITLKHILLSCYN
eukprot:432458_1